MKLFIWAMKNVALHCSITPVEAAGGGGLLSGACGSELKVRAVWRTSLDEQGRRDSRPARA